MIWAKEETLPREEIEAIQLEKLKKLVKRMYDGAPYFRKKMDDLGLKPDCIQTIKDVQKLPFTTKQEMRDNYPFKMLMVPMSDIVRIHASSGTTGKPTVVAYTKADLDMWSECVARLAVAGGATKDDIAQICFGYGMFTGALGLHNGLEKVGAAIIPSSTGNTQKQLLYMKDFGSTLLVATPSYAMRIAEVAKEIGIDPKKDLKLKIGLLGSELLTEAMRTELHKVYGEDMLITQNYGMSELIGPGVSGECEYLCGMHVNEDHFLIEIIDPATGEVLPAGEKGEVVITCLDKEALPLIRYRTRDISRLFYEKCKCGRTTVRMENLSGRTDDMLKIRGVNVFPSQIEEALLGIDGIGPNYEIVVEKNGSSDVLTIRVELDPFKMQDSMAFIANLEKTIKDKIKFILGLDAKIKIENPNTLQRFEGKAKRVRDLRNA